MNNELEGVSRMHVYAPVITDATFRLNDKCYTGLRGREIVGLLRYGEPNFTKKAKDKKLIGELKHPYNIAPLHPD